MDPSNKISLKYGLWCGLAYIIFTFICYFIDKKLVINPGVQWLGMIIGITFMVLGMKKVRSENGESMDFNLGMKSGFIIGVSASFMYWIVLYLLYNVMDPGMEDVTREYAQEMADWGTSFLGDKMTDEAKEMMDQELEKQDFGMSIGRAMFKWAGGSIGNFILAVILAAILKRD